MHLPFIRAELDRLYNKEGLKIRSKQKASVLREIYRMESPSRRAIVNSLNIRSSTVSSLIDELISSGIVIENGRQIKERGRPRLSLGLVPDSRLIISIYADDLRIRGGLVNMEEKVSSEIIQKIPKETDRNKFLRLFEEMVSTLLSFANKDSKVIGIAFCPIGTVDSAQMIWKDSNRWPYIRDVMFDSIKNRFNLPIKIRRNIETVLDYEIQTTTGFKNKKVTLFHWGYGIGSAFALNGVTNDNQAGGFSGIGHTLIYPSSTKICNCGARGCLEAEAAIWKLLPQFAEIDSFVLEDTEHAYEKLAESLSTKYDFFKDALEAVKIGLYNLCKIYKPDFVLFLSPFARNDEVVRMLKETVENSFPEFVGFQPKFQIIEGNYRGALYANVYPFIREELIRIIIG